MKSVSQVTDSHTVEERRAALADQFLQDSGYLPPRGDQSWRELAALRIAPGHDESDDGMTADADLVPSQQERVFEPELGHRGRILIPLVMVIVILPLVVVLTAPEMLTPGFWRAHDASAGGVPQAAAPAPSLANRAASSPAISAQAASPMASEPARTAERVPAPRSVPDRNLNAHSASSDRAAPSPGVTAKAAPPLASEPARTAAKARAPQSIPDQESKSAAASNNLPAPTTAPNAQRSAALAERERAQDQGTARFRTLVVGTDGTLKYQYFPTDPSAHDAERNVPKDDGTGFYAMAPDPDGTLRYRYFPSKPSH